MKIRFKRRKVRVGLLLWKAIIYRICIIVLQIFITQLFIKNIKTSIIISVVWNIINTIVYFFYDWAFASTFKIGEGD